jgi:hypothetical protein
MNTPATPQQNNGIKYEGRIFKIVSNTTPQGIERLFLGIAEHPNPNDQDETVFHKKVVATRELAATLKALDPPLKVGERVEIVKSYPYKWPYTKGGEEKYNEGENLWVIKVRGKKYAAKRQKKENGNARDP